MWPSWLFDFVYIPNYVYCKKIALWRFFGRYSLNYWGLRQHFALNVPNSIERKYVLGQSPFRFLASFCNVVSSCAFPFLVPFATFLSVASKGATSFSCQGKSLVDVDATTADSGLEILFVSVRIRIFCIYYVRYSTLEWLVSILFI